MGWTSYHASFYKNGKIDRKAECDSIMNCDMVGNKGRYEVLKSAMVGSTYYAAVKKSIFKTGDKSEKESVFGVVMLTSVNNKDYFTFLTRVWMKALVPVTMIVRREYLMCLPLRSMSGQRNGESAAMRI